MPKNWVPAPNPSFDTLQPCSGSERTAVSCPDNGSCFRRQWAEGCAARGIAVRKTRPYRPQTNGKAERFIRTLLELWAYAYPYEHERQRAAALRPVLESYNRFRRHRALGGLTPLQRVNNLSGTNT
jgi:transposase InsO family protein